MAHYRLGVTTTADDGKFLSWLVLVLVILLAVYAAALFLKKWINGPEDKTNIIIGDVGAMDRWIEAKESKVRICGPLRAKWIQGSTKNADNTRNGSDKGRDSVTRRKGSNGNNSGKRIQITIRRQKKVVTRAQTIHHQARRVPLLTRTTSV